MGNKFWTWLKKFAARSPLQRHAPVRRSRYVPTLEVLEERVQLSAVLLAPNPVHVADRALLASPVTNWLDSSSFSNQAVAVFTDASPQGLGTTANYNARIDWGDQGQPSPATIVETAPVSVTVYQNFSLTGAGTPFSNPIGTFGSADVQFGTNNEYSWHPFGLEGFGADIKGNFSVAVAGNYTFHLTSDDGSQLFVDNSPAITNGGVHVASTAAGSVFLSAGVHPFELQSFEDGSGPSGINLALPSGVTYASTYAVLGSHSYAAGGTYHPSVSLSRTLNHFDIAGTSSPNAGVATAYTVTALDQLEMPVTDFAASSDTINLSSSAPSASFSPSASLSASAFLQGSATVQATFNTLGDQTFTVSDSTSQIANSADLTVEPNLTLSGNANVASGSLYTLHLSSFGYSFTGSANVTSWTINWGDDAANAASQGGDVQTFVGDPATVTHVYTDAPNAYLISAFATGSFGVAPASNQLLVNVLIPAVASATSGAFRPGQNGALVTPDGTASAGVIQNALTVGPPLIVFLAHYESDPELGQSPNVSNSDGQTFINPGTGPLHEAASYDLRVTGVQIPDVVIARFTFGNGTQPQLFYVVPGSNPAHYQLVPQNMWRIVDGAFQVTFTAFTPVSTFDLTGTVFTITDIPVVLVPAALTSTTFVEVLNSSTSTPTNNEDFLAALLTSQSTNGGGALVGAVAPTQVSSFSLQGSGSEQDGDANRQGRATQELGIMLNAILQQLQHVFGMQLQLFMEGLILSPQTSMFSQPAGLSTIEDLPGSSDSLHGTEVNIYPAPVLSEEPIEAAHETEAIALGDGACPIPLAEPALDDRPWLSCLALVAVPLFPWTERDQERKKQAEHLFTQIP